jgi:GNAT superfamily N-acetyltransferase
MPAMLDDPTAPAIYRTSGDAPYPTPYAPLPANIVPRQVTLRDRSTTATLVPFSSPDQVPKTLLHYLCALLNREIEKGDTYPMINELPLESFGPYWFANFGAVMLMGNVSNVDHVWQMEKEGIDWSKQCLGSFYIKPNYPGRSSHVCNGGFLVSDVARNRGVGRLMGEGYLDWAPQLGYSYSVFNLVYETNIASARIWDALGFKRIGRVPGCGNLKSSDHLVDAIIFGRDLNGEAEDYLSEERFDKIRYYLKTGNYPNGADRAEKSRLRSAGAHYRIVPDPAGGEEKLMLKDKEVISDPQKQYEIALLNAIIGFASKRLCRKPSVTVRIARKPLNRAKHPRLAKHQRLRKLVLVLELIKLLFFLLLLWRTQSYRMLCNVIIPLLEIKWISRATITRIFLWIRLSCQTCILLLLLVRVRRTMCLILRLRSRRSRVMEVCMERRSTEMMPMRSCRLSWLVR